MKTVFKLSTLAGLVILLGACNTLPSLKSNSASPRKESTAQVEHQTSKKVDNKPETSAATQPINSQISEETKALPVSDESIPPESKFDLMSTIEIGNIQLSKTTIKPNHVDLNIKNMTQEPLEVKLVKTDLELSQLPMKQGNLDMNQENVKLIGDLVTSPLKPGKTEVIRRTLEPGRYLLIAYPHEKFSERMGTVLTVKR